MDFSEWSLNRNAGPAKTWNSAAWATHAFQFSSFNLMLPSYPHAPTFVHLHDHFDFDYSRMPSKSMSSLHFLTISPCPFASHTDRTRFLCLPVVFLVKICVCLQIALRTCCSSLATAELMTDCKSRQTRDSRAYPTRKSRPASSEHKTQLVSLLSH